MSLPIVAPDPVFVSTITSLQDSAITTESSLRNYTLRTWYVGRTEAVPGVLDWGGDPDDIEGISRAFDRNSLGADYAEGLTAAVPVGQTAACKIQSDYLAQLERSFRARHTSLVRARMHAAGRRLGHSDGAGVLARAAVMAEDLIAAGNL